MSHFITDNTRAVRCLLGAVCLSWTLVACQRPVDEPRNLPADSTTAQQPIRTTEVPGIPASGVDLSVPSAAPALARNAALAQVSAASAGSGSQNQRDAMTLEQSRHAMPLPGQANDHSNTVAEDKAVKK